MKAYTMVYCGLAMFSFLAASEREARRVFLGYCHQLMFDDGVTYRIATEEEASSCMN